MNILLDELLEIIFKDTFITTKRLISKRMKKIANNEFCNKMYYISKINIVAYIYSNESVGLQISNGKCYIINEQKCIEHFLFDYKKCSIHFDINDNIYKSLQIPKIDLLSKITILKKRCNEENKNIFNIRNIIEKDLMGLKLFFYNTKIGTQKIFYNYLLMNSKIINIKSKNECDIEFNVYDNIDDYININKILYKKLKDYINNYPF